MAWVVVWVGLGLAVGLLVAATVGRDAATEYVAASLLEESLSVDDIIVFEQSFLASELPSSDPNPDSDPTKTQRRVSEAIVMAIGT
jgi:hypothetical protein